MLIYNKGPVFEGNFKAIHLATDEQLVHLSRYIHLNPVTAFIVEKPEDYLYSSYQVYLDKTNTDFIDPSLVLAQFSSSKEYHKFVMDQKDYQRSLSKIKYLLLE